MADKYGIPEGGNNGAWSVKWYAGNKHQISWEEMVASVALGGWPQHLWAEAVATAGAESSRQPYIYNTYKKGHFGLFQISRAAWPDFFKPDGKGMGWISTEVNARQGYEIYKQQGWRAWEAHTNGSYAANLPAAKLAVARVKRKGTSDQALRSWYSDKTANSMIEVLKYDKDSGYPGSTAETVGDAVGDAAGAVADATGLTALTDFLGGAWEAITNPSVWMRVGYGALGVVLVAGGLFLVVRSSPAVQKTASAAARAVPAVRAVKGA